MNSECSWKCLIFYFAVANLGCVSGVRRKEDMLWFSSLRDLYDIQVLFVDEGWKKAEIMA